MGTARRGPDFGAPRPRDDRLLAPTRFVSTAVIPFLLGGWVILYLFPGSTERL